jgi:glycosyltransferase involved in cell wall biosynthesis
MIFNVAIVTTTPQIIRYFLTPHIKKWQKIFNLTLIYNLNLDGFCKNEKFKNVKIISSPIQRKISLFFDVLSLLHLIWILNNKKINLILTVGPKAGLLGQLAAAVIGIRKRVHIFQGQIWFSKKGIIRNILRFSDYLIGKICTEAIAVSPGERVILCQEGLVNKRKISLVGNGTICGVDLNRFKKNKSTRYQIRKILGIPQSAIVGNYVGRLKTEKGVIDLIKAFILATKSGLDLWLIIVGPDEENIVSVINNTSFNNKPLKIKIIGFSENPEKYMQASDFLCLPSHREGFGMTLIEAGAIKLPVIGSNIYGIQDAVVSRKTGLLVPPRDPNKLAKAILYLAKNPYLRKKMGEAGFKRVVKLFNQKQVIAAYQLKLKKILNNVN